MTFDFNQLQAEQMPWVLHNFGDRPSWMPLMGIVEELGELVEAATAGKHHAMRDGIADAIIFMADYCTAVGWNLQELWDARTPCKTIDTTERTRMLIVAAGKMQHHHLKLAQGIRGGKKKHHDGGKLAARWLLWEMVWVYPFSPDKKGRDRSDVQADEVIKAVKETWAEVKKRDWKKKPVTAGDG